MPNSATAHSKKAVPLVRTTILRPILSAYRAAGHDEADILGAFHIDEARLSDPETFITHDTVYKAYNLIAERAGADFCARTGQSLEWRNIVPFADRLNAAATLGDFFTTFAAAISKESNAVNQSFLVEQEHAYFAAHRRFRPSTSPAQMDAFQISIWVSFLHRVLDFRWDPANVLVRLADPRVLPTEFLGIRAIQCEPVGFSIRIPADWLAHSISRGALALASEPTPNAPPGDAPADVLGSIKDIIRSQLGNRNTSVETVAQACGFSVSTLNRRLAAQGLTVSKVMAEVRLESSQSLLVETQLSIGEIASQLGYSDATAFTRAFRTWTGTSPSKFQKRNRLLQAESDQETN